MKLILCTTIGCLLVIFAILSVIQEGYWTFALFLTIIGVFFLLPVVNQINGNLSTEQVEVKENKFRPHTIY